MSIVFLCLLVFLFFIKLYNRAKKSDLMKNYKIAQLKNGKYKVIEKGKPILTASKYLQPVDTLEKVKENYVKIYLIMKEKEKNKVDRYIE